MKFKVPEGCASVSWDGVEYAVKKGIVDAPAEAAPDLAPHGVVPVADPNAAPASE